MSLLSTHVLDTANGTPARGIAVTLAISRGSGDWDELAHGVTDRDGRIAEFSPALGALEARVYRLRFATGDYFEGLGIRAFFPQVDVVFQIDDPGQRYHVPLLLSPFGYSTYRGS